MRARPTPVAVVFALALLAGGAGPRPALPPIVFVSRQPDPAGAIPGLGPHGRAIGPGGRLMRRAPNGAVSPLLSKGAPFDAADPAVSPDGRRVAFAALDRRGGAWRVWVAGVDGAGARAVTTPPEGADDLDPCWIDDDLIAFASTRGGARAQYADVAVTNLWLARVSDGAVARLTWERNGAEEPAFDPATGHLVYARWWFNRFMASAHDPDGLTTDAARALPRDSVNLWQAVELAPDAGPRLAMGAFASRRASMAYQPARLADGSWVGVFAGNLGLSPGAQGAGIQRFTPRFGRARPVIGALVAERGGDAYHGARGLAPASACAPAGLPDGRLVFAYDPGGRGDFDLYVAARDGARLEPLVARERTLELDPAPVVARGPAPGAARAIAGWHALLVRAAGAEPRTFTYDCRDVFARGSAAGMTPGAPARAPGLSLRFFVVRPAADGRDSAVQVRVARVEPSGRVRVAGLPAETPMFEQLVDRDGHPVAGALGPAHVAGSNFGRAGTTSACAGCHLGHSTLAVR